uniref:Uncharacterized protein n=1 Tax=Magallana gigas TaxID=29159 RepID=K1S0C9_MAGGI
MMGFNKTRVCEKRNLFQNVSTDSERIACSLESLKHVKNVIANTLEFWNLCVEDLKNGHIGRSGAFCLLVFVFIVAGINANRCRPCDGPNSRFTEHLNNCDHQVTKEHVLLSLKALNYTFTSFRHKVEKEINPVDSDHINPTCVQNPVSAEMKKRLPKRCSKDRFVHETYAKLSYAKDVLEGADKTFKTFAPSLWNKSAHVQRELTNVMCNMVKVNRKIHCRKNKNKPSRRLIGFKKSGVCETRDLFPYVSSSSEHAKIACSLESLKHVQIVIAETLGFWNSGVEDSKNGPPLHEFKASKAIEHWLGSSRGRHVNGHQAPERKSRQNENDLYNYDEFEVYEK